MLRNPDQRWPGEGQLSGRRRPQLVSQSDHLGPGPSNVWATLAEFGKRSEPTNVRAIVGGSGPRPKFGPEWANSEETSAELGPNFGRCGPDSNRCPSAVQGLQGARNARFPKRSREELFHARGALRVAICAPPEVSERRSFRRVSRTWTPRAQAGPPQPGKYVTKLEIRKTTHEVRKSRRVSASLPGCLCGASFPFALRPDFRASEFLLTPRPGTADAHGVEACQRMGRICCAAHCAVWEWRARHAPPLLAMCAPARGD